MNLFEREVLDSLEFFEKRNELIGEKIIEKITRKYFSYGPSRFDFWVLKGGIFFGVECKSKKLSSDSQGFTLSSSTLRKQNILELSKLSEHGGVGIVFLRYQYPNRIYGLMSEISSLLEFFLETGKKTIRKEDFSHFIEVPHTIRNGKRIWNLNKLENFSPVSAKKVKLLSKLFLEGGIRDEG